MAAALRAALCSGLLLLVSGMVPEPQNVRITSVNLHSTLQWDAPRFPRGNLTYTVQSKSIYYPGDSFETLGTELRLPQCDVSSLSPYGSYALRLRAEAGELHSPWVTLPFKPMDDTSIGAPEVRLRSEQGALHVDLSGPFAEHGQERWPLRLYYGSWSYRILYWRKGSRDTDPASASWAAQVDTRHSSEILAQLEPWTVYCVRVQALIPEWNKTGQLSRELCEQTTHNGVTPVWIIVTVLVGSMLVVGTAVTVCFFFSFYVYRLIKHVFCPSYIFPEHLKEFLSKPPGAPQPFPPREELLVCDKLTVIAEQSQTLPGGAGDGASRTPELPQDPAQGD
ncbi:interleukin-10 receptor subunit beta isoform X2 [Molothrus ater]|uniref:interleukin-10 receptor subunit beta isoform X2 n=2 Tax=Molothrus ater TaxID=84834 RepID=UPI00174BBFCA|nr:interleukin-10 receptor subunit beta isoform X2 [Molothrus ater]